KTPKTGNNRLNAGCMGATATTDLNLPANGVIYVQNNPTSTTQGDRITSGCTSPCNGDVSVQGVLKGQLTIATDNDVNIIGDVTYNTYPGGTDVLGLVALNNVAVCHGTTPCNTPHTIDAAILALQHSFYVQSWDTGSNLGQLTVNGVIAQKYRGAVGTFSGT